MSDDPQPITAEQFNTALGDFAEHDMFKGGRVPDVQTLAKRFVDSQTEVSRRVPVPASDASDEDKAKYYERLQTAAPDLVRVPGADAPPEDWKPLYAKLGVPETPEGYEAPDTKDPNTKNIFEAIAPAAHALGVNNKQLAGLISKMDELGSGAQEQLRAQAAEADASLKEAWGDAYGDKVMFARMFAEHHGLSDIIEKNPIYGNNVPLMKVFAELGAKLAESEPVQTTLRRGTGMATPDELIRARDSVMNDPKHPYHNPGTRGHNQAVQDMLALNRKIASHKPPSAMGTVVIAPGGGEVDL